MPEARDERLDLAVEDGVLLWCMRIWVVGLHRPIQKEHRIGEILTRLGVPDAAPALETFMAALNRGATRSIGLDCVCQTTIGRDEYALLDVFALAQQGRTFEAMLLLRELMTAESARSALASAEAVGAALARSGRFLKSREANASRFVMASGSAIRAEGSTLH